VTHVTNRERAAAHDDDERPSVHLRRKQPTRGGHIKFTDKAGKMRTSTTLRDKPHDYAPKRVTNPPSKLGVLAIIQDSAAALSMASLISDVARYMFAVVTDVSGQTYRSHLKRSGSPKTSYFSITTSVKLNSPYA
jgi:hypothetical protein